ncbi:hypothetical protein [Aeromicrobium wangtongii]|uniref:DUF302 domain-containing protein n=1 Tax=Aeromicrobium wangtongii TaxID=2969247 RepID=A0ABY5M2B8_9ACTN|nr:hypothetical protein [Aeromicrobium wangtongii]MCD9198313.1 hypothetical protein [Aeromicrobium wangtongii]UUP12345.1 hypothetical protein NQV15_10810 [Aeromicrobium wangtongii]
MVSKAIDDDIPAHPVLCFVEADWPLIGCSFNTCGVDVLWPKKLYPKFVAKGPAEAEMLGDLHRRLAGALPRA